MFSCRVEINIGIPVIVSAVIIVFIPDKLGSQQYRAGIIKTFQTDIQIDAVIINIAYRRIGPLQIIPFVMEEIIFGHALHKESEHAFVQISFYAEVLACRARSNSCTKYLSPIGMSLSNSAMTIIIGLPAYFISSVGNKRSNFTFNLKEIQPIVCFYNLLESQGKSTVVIRFHE